MDLKTRFLQYTRINTTTNQIAGSAGVMPSSLGQIELGKLIVKELNEMQGITNIEHRDNGIVTATLPSNCGDELPSVAFFGHLDTSSEHIGDTHAKLVNYQGGYIKLGHGEVLTIKDNPELNNYIGQEIFVTDGTSLLGADDKAAIAAIMNALEVITSTPSIKHGKVSVAFVPDEEQGLLGANAFNTPDFADFGYTLDCCGIGEFVKENWNAGNAVITFHGKSAHPMNSKGNLKNSLLMAQQFITYFPRLETPENTEGRDGYYWMKKLDGNSAKTVLNIDIRDFTKEGYLDRKCFIDQACRSFNNLYGDGTLTYNISDRYENVSNYLNNTIGNMAISLAEQAYIKNGIEMKVIPMRGGYDGAVFSANGIPCPNIFTGAHNFHSICEYLPVPSLLAASNVVQTIIMTIAEDK
ncbi:peptidase T [Photobacterium frigidiphilum]|uniref:Peptidase T n=1 Tax=Photobacterium frigidiphilum TaxID=264736 RepID=A0A2T3J791_9GAMM|nr:peptidase T [Photobacterium frigidiphilum]PSU44629.1 peptidase T [Photobacterium frigidiphilum]